MSKAFLARSHTMDLLDITEDLPTLPDRFLKIQGIINDPNSSMGDIANIIQTDQATTVMVMKIANSPAYNPMNKPINNLSQAIARLGTNETAEIALSMSLLYGFAIPTGIASIRAFWAHAYGVGQVAKHLASKLPKEMNCIDPETMFIIGLLHDIGKAILGIRIDLTYFEKDQFRISGVDLSSEETAHYGIDHAAVGEIILSRWGLPDEISETVGLHHRSSDKISARICTMADQFSHYHLKQFSSIESVHAALAEGLLVKSEELLVQSGLLKPPVAEG